MRKNAAIVLILSGCLMLSGCAVLDGFFGVGATGEDEPGSSISETVGSVADGLGFGGVGTLLGGLGWLYSSIRGKKYKQIAKGGIRSIDVIMEAMKDGKIDKEEMLKILRAVQEEEGVHGATLALREEVRSA
jgi:hypothetical protein